METTNVLDVIDQSKELFKDALSTQEISWHRESQFALQALQSNDYLAKIASESQHTLQNAIINIAAIGISLNPALKHAYLVPRSKAVILDISYMGLLHLAVKTGSIVYGQSKIVYANDVYENNGIDKAPTHNQKTFGDKGEVIGAYCTVKLPSGDYLTEEMDIAELNKIRAASSSKQGGNNPWTNWPLEMMRKSVVKRAAKYWPISERLAAATNYLNETQGNAAEIDEAQEIILEEYTEQQFEDNLPKWLELILEGRQSPDSILDKLQSRFVVSEDIIERFRSAVAVTEQKEEIETDGDI